MALGDWLHWALGGSTTQKGREFLMGKPGGAEKLPAMSKEQQKLLNMLIGQLQGGGLGQGFGEATDYWRELMDPSSAASQKFAEPYQREFEQVTVPNLAERFAGMGGSAMGGGLSSSGFGQALSGAGANLQSTLAALKGQLGMQASGQLAQQYGQQLGMGLGAKPFGYMYQPGNQGFLTQALQAYMQGGFPGMGG